MGKLLLTYTYKFALITKEQQSIGKFVWRCHLAGSIRSFPSLCDAKRLVDNVEVNLARQAKAQQSCHQTSFETLATTRSDFLLR
jgi:hypothetical protein